MKNRKSATQLSREAQADKAFTKRQGQVQRSDGVFAVEAKRVSSNAAKTRKLRALREERDASKRTD